MKTPLIVAHRGSSYVAPENTIPAFQLAFLEKADFIEGDFWLTRDNKIVCIHDSNTRRVNKNKLKLDIRKSSLVELQKVDVGSWKNDKYINAKIPTLKDIFNFIPKGKGIFIEIKDNREKFVLRLVEEINNLSLPLNKVRIISFSKETVQLVKKYLPDVKVYWLFAWYFTKNYFFKTIAQKRIIETINSINCDGVNLSYSAIIDESLVNFIREKELDFCAFNVESVEAALRLKDLGIDYITTNSPLLIRNGISGEV